MTPQPQCTNFLIHAICSYSLHVYSSRGWRHRPRRKGTAKVASHQYNATHRTTPDRQSTNRRRRCSVFICSQRRLFFAHPFSVHRIFSGVRLMSFWRHCWTTHTHTHTWLAAFWEWQPPTNLRDASRWRIARFFDSSLPSWDVPYTENNTAVYYYLWPSAHNIVNR